VGGKATAEPAEIAEIHWPRDPIDDLCVLGVLCGCRDDAGGKGTAELAEIAEIHWPRDPIDDLCVLYVLCGCFPAAGTTKARSRAVQSFSRVVPSWRIDG